MTELELAARLAIAALAGMAVGLERQWSGKASGPHARFAGIRTFFLLGSIGGVAGWLLNEEAPLIAAALLLATGGLIVTAYFLAARKGAEAIEGTTETAALLVLGIGLLAGMGSLRLASGATAVIVLVLREKETVHQFIRRIGEHEMSAALQFAVLALVVLPLLPEGPIEQLGGMRPRSLWTVVLIFSGLSFAGYIARRILGDSRGYPVMGALGGLVSSTAVTLNFSRQSRSEPESSVALALGTVAASTVVILRVLGLTLVLNPALLPATALGLALVFVAGALVLLLGWKHLAESPHKTPPAAHNPLQLRQAILMAVAFQLVLVILEAATRRFGESGVLASAVALGLTDMDALTFGMNQLAESPDLVPLAARAILLGFTVNGVVKATMAASLGAPAYRRLALPGLLVMSGVGAVGVWLLPRLVSAP